MSEAGECSEAGRGTPEGWERDGLRIGVVNDWWRTDGVGGAESSVFECASHLARNGFLVHAITPSPVDAVVDDSGLLVHRVARPSARERAQAGAREHVQELVSTWADPRSASRLARELVAFSPHVVVTHNVQRVHPSFFRMLRAMLPQVPVVRVLHDLSDTCWLRTRYRAERPCSGTCPRCRPKAAAMVLAYGSTLSWVIANSRFTLSSMREAGLFKGVPASVGYPGLAHSLRLQNEPSPSRDADRPWPRLGFLGRVTREKGVFAALEAVERVRSIHPGAEFVIAGGVAPAMSAEVTDAAAGRGVPIQILGRIPVTRFAAEVDVALVPSLWPEPFGRVAVELAALGVPAVVSGRGGLPESASIIPGAPVRVVADPTPAGISSAVLDLLESPVAGAGTAPAACSRASLEAVLLTTVNHLLGRGGPPPQVSADDDAALTTSRT